MKNRVDIKKHSNGTCTVTDHTKRKTWYRCDFDRTVAKATAAGRRVRIRQ